MNSLVMERFSFLPQFLRLAGINILSNLMVPLAGLVDVAFLGHLAIQHLAGVALATILFNYIYWSFGFLRMATTGMTAQAMGRGNRPEILIIGLRNCLLALCLGLLIIALQHPFREIGFALLHATPEVQLSGKSFYNALIWGAPATLINFVLIGWFLGQAQGRKVLLLSVIGNGANISLDYLLIVKLGGESAGAGAATAISQYIMLAVGAILVAHQWHEYTGALNQQELRSQIFNPSALKEAFSLNGDILIRTLALISTFAIFTNLSSAFGTIILAGNTLLLQIVTLSAYFVDGFAFATESFAGRFYGREHRDYLKPLIQVAGAFSLGFGIAIALLACIFPTPLFNLLTNHLEVVNSASDYVLWLLPVLALGSIAYMLDGYFLGLTAGRILRKSALMASLLGFLPLSFMAWQLKNNHLLWLALTGFMVGRAVTLALKLDKTLQLS
ncbi:putative efflux protein, MATE family [Synechococcus sp. PCC 7502]|uniref:guanitoxin biosynthesis MATE family efflux transporter GntT n=1 Tax=Synechococcus sp. PCC 7502 TaxID=1173263 RepID=UPI00029FC14B|nr:guanitoxin biosynthesis MATE family efflux transporter GntT [Synechococcus sp. PCC 7502]AFY72680.1 putative efflux protein, MATE family [Synechococcus sp. PCC 7502]